MSSINPFDILKNAQKLQEQMGNLQDKLGNIKVTGFSGGGMVTVELNGRMEVLSIKISPDAMNLQDLGLLEDLIKSAFTDGIEKIREAISQELGAMAGGLGIPNLGGLFPGFGASGA